MFKPRLLIAILVVSGSWTSLDAQPLLSLERRDAERLETLNLTLDLLNPVNQVGSISLTLEADVGLNIDELQYVGRQADFVFGEIIPPTIATFQVLVDDGGVPLEFFEPSTVAHPVVNVVVTIDLTSPGGLRNVDFSGSQIPLEVGTPGGIMIPGISDGRVLVRNPCVATTVENQLWFPGDDDNVHIVDPAGNPVATAMPPGNPTGAEAIAIAPEGGRAWVAYTNSSIVVRFAPDGTVVPPPLPTEPNPVAIAIDARGEGWVVCAGGELNKYTCNGALLLGTGGLNDATLLGGDPVALAIDRFDKVWVALANPPQLVRVNDDGRVGLRVDLDLEPVDVQVDRRGFVWVALKDPALIDPGAVVRFASDGSQLDDLDDLELPAGADTYALAIRSESDDSQQAWVVVRNSTQIYRVRPFTTGVTEFEIDPTIVDPAGVLVDGDGNVWVRDAASPLVYEIELDGSGNPQVTNPFPTPVSGSLLGDASGNPQANVLRPEDDFDEDGFPNAGETSDVTRNPFAFDGLVTPPIRDLECRVDGSDVTLTWTNAQAYSGITIDNGVVSIPVSGTAESFVHMGVADGIYDYSVTPDDPPPAPPVVCPVVVGDGALRDAQRVEYGDRTPIITDVAIVQDAGLPFGPPGPVKTWVVDAANRVVLGQDENGETVRTVRCIDGLGTQFAPTSVAFNADGGSGTCATTDGTLYIGNTDGTGNILIEELCADAGKHVETIQPLNGGVPISGRAESMSFRDPHLFFTVPQVCEIWAIDIGAGFPYEIVSELSVPHPGGNEYGETGIDARSSSSPLQGGPVAEIDLTILNGTSFEVQRFIVADSLTTPMGDPIPLLALDPDDIVFGGFSTDDATGIISITGITSSTKYEVQGPDSGGPSIDFIRGDVDGNGVLNALVDSLYLLAFGFQGGPPPICLEAADVDGNSDLNALVDVVYLLLFGFMAGPPPPPPFPLCGPDPDPGNSFGCAPTC